jgi:hypothetical protein
MSTYADPYLNQLAQRIAAYEALTPRDEQHARDIALRMYPQLMRPPVVRAARRRQPMPPKSGMAPHITIGSHIPVIEAWGFRPCTVAFDWIKQNPSGEGLHTGLGHHTRSNAEYCLHWPRAHSIPPGCRRRFHRSERSSRERLSWPIATCAFQLPCNSTNPHFAGCKSLL